MARPENAVTEPPVEYYTHLTPEYVTSMSWLILIDLSNGKKVLLKILNPQKQFKNKQAVIEAFLNEIETLKKIGEHPNITTLLGTLKKEGVEFFLEYLDPAIWKNGADIVWANRIKNHPNIVHEPTEEDIAFDLTDMAYIVVQAIEVLKYAIIHHLLHRDLKPSNMFYQRGYLIIGDWAAAGALGKHKGPLFTLDYLNKQTTLFDAPVEIADELHALVVSFYELLTGCLPYASDTVDTSPIHQRKTTVIDKEDGDPLKKIRKNEVYFGDFDFSELRKCRLLTSDQAEKIRSLFRRVLFEREFTTLEGLDQFVKEFLLAIGITEEPEYFHYKPPATSDP